MSSNKTRAHSITCKSSRPSSSVATRRRCPIQTVLSSKRFLARILFYYYKKKTTKISPKKRRWTFQLFIFYFISKRWEEKKREIIKEAMYNQWNERIGSCWSLGVLLTLFYINIRRCVKFKKKIKFTPSLFHSLSLSLSLTLLSLLDVYEVGSVVDARCRGRCLRRSISICKGFTLHLQLDLAVTHTFTQGVTT